MASIPWAAYMIIGAGIAVYAKIVARTTGDNTAVMDMFFYIGLFLAGVGAVKLVFKIKSKEKKPIAPKHHEKHRAVHAPKEHQHTKPLHEAHHAKKIHHTIIHCTCGTKNYSTSNFCHKCGKALRQDVGKNY